MAAGGEPGLRLAGRAAIVLLSAGCLVTAASLPLVIRVIAAGLSPVVPAAVTTGALKSPWVVQPVFGGFSILSPSWLWVVMPLLALAAVAFTLAGERAPADPGAAGARVAVGHRRGGGRGLLHRDRLRQPDPAGPGDRPAYPGGGALPCLPAGTR